MLIKTNSKFFEKKFGKVVLLDFVTPTMAVMHKVRKVLYRKKTRYHKIEIVDTYDRGVCFVLNDQIQSSLNDEWIYHEALVHPTMTTHPKPLNVLVIGGGEGGVIREVLRHNVVKQVTMVEISKDVIKIAKKYLKEIHQGSFYSTKVKIVINDGRNYLIKQPANSFDCVIIDATDPSPRGISAGLYTKEFYEIVEEKLRREGLMVTQATSPLYNPHVYASIYKTISSVFPVVRGYSFGAGYVIGSKKFDPLSLSKKEIKKRLKKRRMTRLKLYNENTHHLMFVLPEHMKTKLKLIGDILTDAKMLS
jgi:spermidine synthase